MISILFLIPTLDRGGAENVLVDLVNHMDQSIFQITVQTLFDQNSQKDRLREGIEYKSFLYHQFHGNSRLQALIPARVLYRLIVKKRYDIVVSYLEGPTAHIISGCPYSDSKKVAWIHSALDTKSGIAVGFASIKTALKAYRQYDKVVFVAESAKQKVEETTGTLFKNACVLYNAINSKEILSRAGESVSGVFFLKDEFKIVSTGKVVPVKGYDRLARIQKKLVEEGYRTHVYILGEGKDRKTIETYISENGLSEVFSFLGFQDNPYKYVAKADLFVCSSRREGFSTAVSEAIVLGIPVVSTNCSGAYELLGKKNEFGIVTENDENSLYEGIKRLLEDSNLLKYYRERAAEKGKSFIVENTVKEIEKTLYNVYCK